LKPVYTGFHPTIPRPIHQSHTTYGAKADGKNQQRIYATVLKNSRSTRHCVSECDLVVMQMKLAVVCFVVVMVFCLLDSNSAFLFGGQGEGGGSKDLNGGRLREDKPHIQRFGAGSFRKRSAALRQSP